MTKLPTKEDVFQRLKSELPYLREKYGLERIALYGSFARSEQAEKSDVDLLVELAEPLGLEFFELSDHLEKILGRKVDLAEFDDLHRSKQNPFRRHIVMNIEKDLVYVS